MKKSDIKCKLKKLLFHLRILYEIKKETNA